MEREWEAKVRRVPSEKHRYHRVLATEEGKVNRLYNSTARALPAHLWSDDKLGGDRREASATAQGNHEMHGWNKGK
ncbi:hypothetical protein KFU94_00850 [Chloroflexi bacterium TSY]|nr:hypothetical protein [Chloroflexi bacterium TSY]